MNIQKTGFIAVITALALIGGMAVAAIPVPAHASCNEGAGGPCHSGPGNSGQVQSPSLTQCEKKSPGNSPCKG
jgi:hypothetical protein